MVAYSEKSSHSSAIQPYLAASELCELFVRLKRVVPAFRSRIWLQSVSGSRSISRNLGKALEFSGSRPIGGRTTERLSASGSGTTRERLGTTERLTRIETIQTADQRVQRGAE